MKLVSASQLRRAKQYKHYAGCTGYEDCTCFGRYYSVKEQYAIQLAYNKLACEVAKLKAKKQRKTKT